MGTTARDVPGGWYFGGWKMVRKRVEKTLKTGGKKSETGKTSEKMGTSSEFGD
jgi:hypothetical protein